MFLRSCGRRTEEADKLKVLSAGADDYICKPFGLAQLALRIEVVLRRMKPVTSSRIVFDRFPIDSARRKATLNDRIIRLAALKFNILYFLASHSGQSWSRQQLIEKIWGWNCDDTGEEQVVSVDIGQIRKKMIQVDATGYGFIKTIGGYGYRFDPPDCTAMAIY
jgi:two-component system, OmpR family, alkaline phosphatase synthesis response regulator PhoP